MENRSERANEVAQNTCKNKHLRDAYCDENGDGVPDRQEGGSGSDGTGTTPAEIVTLGSQGEQLFYYHPDHLGSTGYVTRENGKLHEHIQYFPFGETWVQQGGNTEKSPYLFTSKELDEETGLYYFGARYYDPRTSVWQSADPILDIYLDGAPSGGILMPTNLSLYHYSAWNPVRFKDDDGEFVNFLVGATLGAGFDFAVQTALIVTGHQDSYDKKSILISATAGATGVGLAALANKAQKLGTVAKVGAEIAADATVSVGSKAAKGEDVTVAGVIADVALGQAGGKIGGKVARSRAEASHKNTLLNRAADRAERIANNPKVGRPDARQRQANAARQRQEHYLNEAELRGGLVGSGTGQSVGELMNPPEANNDQ